MGITTSLAASINFNINSSTSNSSISTDSYKISRGPICLHREHEKHLANICIVIHIKRIFLRIRNCSFSGSCNINGDTFNIVCCFNKIILSWQQWTGPSPTSSMASHPFVNPLKNLLVTYINYLNLCFATTTVKLVTYFRFVQTFKLPKVNFSLVQVTFSSARGLTYMVGWGRYPA